MAIYACYLQDFYRYSHNEYAISLTGNIIAICRKDFYKKNSSFHVLTLLIFHLLVSFIKVNLENIV